MFSLGEMRFISRRSEPPPPIYLGLMEVVFVWIVSMVRCYFILFSVGPFPSVVLLVYGSFRCRAVYLSDFHFHSQGESIFI